MIKNMINPRRMVQFSLSVVMMTGLSACASTNVVKMTEAAPITYKMGKGGAKYASLSIPKSLPKSTRPRRPSAVPAIPSPYTPRQEAPTGPSFNSNEVDTQLYSHQKVGRRYTIMGKSYSPKHNPNYDKTGIASWYGEKFHGRKTATGEIYNMNDITAAHKTLPLNSLVHVENLENGRTLIVRVNDRGPFAEGRIIDLSKSSAKALGTLQGGLARVRVRYIGPADPNAAGGPIALPPVYEEAPSLTVEAPQYKPEPYVAPQLALPSVPQEYFDVPTPQKSTPLQMNPIAPSAPTPAPMADLEPEADGQVTLTIKGPIHIAKYQGAAGKPRLIRGGNRKTYKTKNKQP